MVRLDDQNANRNNPMKRLFTGWVGYLITYPVIAFTVGIIVGLILR